DARGPDATAKASLTPSVDDGYPDDKGKETLKDGQPQCEGSFSVIDGSSDLSSVDWTGSSAFHQARKQPSHKVAINNPHIRSALLTLNTKNDAKFKKRIEKPNKDNVKNIGTMSEKELQEYTQEDLLPQILKEFGGGF